MPYDTQTEDVLNRLIKKISKRRNTLSTEAQIHPEDRYIKVQRILEIDHVLVDLQKELRSCQESCTSPS